ncbi:hepcidin-like isoform X2 [Nelusetta ayraudi]|uniref:hepcidin-like isoform X2 n=1 Tax=Nelusetta ayraudi TaxID=303726 RepID=UPI003F6EBBC8
MKTFSVAVAVAVVLTIICIQESSAVPLSEVAEFDVPVYVDTPAAEAAAAVNEESSVDSWKMPYSSRSKRSPAACRMCCGCCPNMSGCGVCCRF